jgi:hypothetical protein
MLGARLLLGALLLGVGLAPMPAQASGGLEFLDNRPVVVDLDEVEAGQQWRVQVLNLAGGDQDVAFHVVFEPVGVVTVAQSPGRFDGDIVEFVIELQRRVAGSGELVAVSGSQVARREIRTQFGTLGSALTVGSLQFAGERIAPFTTLVRIPSIAVSDSPTPTESRPPERIGLLTSTRGDVAEVVRIGDEFVVHGVEVVGEYTGTLDLLPGRDGTPVEATVRVRDLAIWPLLALLAGLAVAHTLDRYQRRHRPQRLHERRLAALRDRARAGERQTDGRLRITAPAGASGEYLLDQLLADARAAFHPHMSDAEREQWEPGGAEYGNLAGTVTRFRQLCFQFTGLEAEQDRLVRTADRSDQPLILEALGRSPVGDALRERAIRSLADLAEAEAPFRAARAYLDRFGTIYARLVQLRQQSSDEIRAESRQLLTELFHASHDLTPVDAASHDLHHRWRHAVEAEPALSVSDPADPGALAPWPEVVAAPVGRPEQSDRRRRLRVLPAVLAAVVVIAIALVALSVLNLTNYLPAPENGAVVDGPTVTPTDAPTRTPDIPNAPVALPGEPAAATGAEPSDPSTGQILWFGYLVPLLLAAAVLSIAWLLIRWRRRRLRTRPDDLDASAIESEVRKEDLRFSVLAGILVVLSGMSVLYVGNPTFGSPGDYLAIVLWGGAVGEGFQLARRVLPGLARS